MDEPINDYVIYAIQDAYHTAKGELVVANGVVADKKKALSEAELQANRILAKLRVFARFLDKNLDEGDAYRHELEMLFPPQ